MRRTLLFCLMIGALACAGKEAPVPAGSAGRDSAPASIPDTEIGLMEGSVFGVPTPEPVHPRAAMPGEAPVLPRPYDLSPPVIPHTVADFLPINQESNYCIVCHQVEEKVAGEPTPIPASHYVDHRRAPHQQGEEVAGARYNCLACHARTTDAPPLVGSQFETNR